MKDAALVLRGIRKSFAGHVAVRDLSLEVPRHSVFGLLGPNGAGKTTTLRIVMDILGPDAGTIEILGRSADRAVRDRIGYMPEERGLYPRMVLEEQLVFMAAIKGVAAKEARRRLGPWLERLSLADWRKRKTNELSKGMQQKAQFIATVLHEPELLIVDEPLSGLDPVGMDVMRDALLDLRRSGTTIVLSSHQMHTVERLCDRVALINRGEKILDGTVSEVKARHGKNTVALAFDGDGDRIGAIDAKGRIIWGDQLLAILGRDVLSLAGAALAKRAFARLKRRVDYTEMGGAPLLGMNGAAIICHGASPVKAIKNAVRVAADWVRNDVNQHIKTALEAEAVRGGFVASGASVAPDAELVAPFFVGAGSQVEAGASLGPDAVLVGDVRVERGAVVRDSVLWPGCEVARDARVEASLLGRGVRVGRNAQLRGALLGEGTLVSEHSRGFAEDAR